MEFPKTLLETIKHRFEETNGRKEMGGCTSESMAPYYVRHLEDNLVQMMDTVHVEEFSSGLGVELGEKMKALRSSSAMTFNLLGNKEIQVAGPVFFGPGTYSVQYEYQLPTLAKNPNKANLDARLVTSGGDSVVYCEMKMVEWLLGWMKMLRVSYFDPQRYLLPPKEAEIFIQLFNCLVVAEANKRGSRKTRFERFDALQMARHLLAIYSSLDGEQARSIKLVNCVWELREPSLLAPYEERYLHMLDTERREFQEFAQAAQAALELFDKRGIDFSLEYLPVDQLLVALEKTEAQQRKLARYLI